MAISVRVLDKIDFIMGWGSCHYFLVGICGLCSLAEASAFLLVTIVTPLLACDLKFVKNDVIILNAILSLGMAFGGVFFGMLADKNGRKSMIPITLVIIFCSTIYLSFSQRYFPISFSIFLFGTGAAGNNVILRVYLIECLPAKRRGTCLALLDLLRALGYLAAFAVAWSLVPSIVRLLNHEFRPSSWRVLAGLGGAFSLVIACAAGLLPSSPRYLLYRRNLDQALAVLQQIYAVNNSRHADTYAPGNLENCVRPYEEDESGSNTCSRSLRNCRITAWKKIKMIFGPPYTGTTLFSLLSRTFLFPGFIWLALWKAYVSQHFDSSRTINNPDKIDFLTCVVNIGDIIQSFLHNCKETNDSSFEYAMLLSISYVIGEGLLFFGIELIGRRLSLITSSMIGTTSILTLIFANRQGAEVILSFFFLTAYAIVNTTVGVIILENYPTSVRATLFGLASMFSHLAAFFVQFYAQIYCTKSMYVATGLIIGATITGLAIPDLTRKPMRE